MTNNSRNDNNTMKNININLTGSKFIPQKSLATFALFFQLVNPKQGLVYFQETKRKSCC